jgi:hypothetical protein
MAAKAPQNMLDVIERWLLRAIIGAVVLLALLLGFAALQTRHLRAVAAAAASSPVGNAISIVVDFGDGAQRRVSGIAFAPGMTVLDAMNAAKERAHSFGFSASGRGETALVSQIDDVANESGQGSRAWQYWINREYGTVSVGAAALKAGDRVSWAFRKYEANPGLPPE